ncbi:hypothetical protein Q7P35_009208 [Cladosporium inversicolor]
MDEIKEPQVYEQLKSLEIADLDPNEFPNNALLYGLHPGFMQFNIKATDLKKPLSEEKRLSMLTVVDRAVVEATNPGYHDSDKIAPAQTLCGIRSLSSLLQPSHVCYRLQGHGIGSGHGLLQGPLQKERPERCPTNCWSWCA